MKISTVVIVLLLLVIMFLGGEFTQAGLDWYRVLKKPAGTPPGHVFTFVWLFIYTLVAICLIRIWKARPAPFGLMMALFVVNGILNLAWSYLFFTKRLMLVAFFDLALLWITICGLIWLLLKTSRFNAYLLVPYGLWVAYAGYLNLGYWVLNH